MAVAIAAEVVGTSDPQTVQVVVTGLTVGEAYEVRGSWTGGQWIVRGGTGVATDTQVVLGDAATPVNTVITYAVVADTGSAASAPVTVDYAGRYVLQALDAQAAAAFRWRDNADPRRLRTRTQVYDIPGRDRPAIRYDVPAGEAGQMVAVTTGDRTADLKALLSTGAPLLIRTDGLIRDLAAVEYIAITGIDNALTGAHAGTLNDRAWSLSFEVIDDPEPDTIVPTATWTDFDAAYDALTWNTFDTEWNALTWNDFDQEDWSTRASTANPLYGFGFGPYGTYPFGQ